MTNRRLIEQVSMPEDDARAPRLTRADWLEKALQMLVESGVDAVRITRLADGLGVTRGSFYWHFQDRAALLDAMLEVWNRKNTDAIQRAAMAGPTLEACILALFEIWLDPGQFDPRLDFAVRDWARGMPAIQDTIRAADQTRLAALVDMYTRHGFDAGQAEIRARNFYFIQMGYYALDVREPMSVRLSLLPIYYQTYTDRPLTPQAEAAFRARVIARPELWGDEVPPSA